MRREEWDLFITTPLSDFKADIENIVVLFLFYLVIVISTRTKNITQKVLTGYLPHNL